MKNTEKNIKLLLSSAIDKVSEEAILAVFALASFEHTVEIALSDQAIDILNQPKHKVFKMLLSLEIYDIELVVFSDEVTDDTLPYQKKPLTELADFITINQYSNDSNIVFWQV